MKLIWKDEFKIHSYEADINSNATIPAISNYLQEIAWNHAEQLELGFSHLVKQNLAWVLARQKISLQKYPKWGDTITVYTWPSGLDRMFFYRDFKIENSNKEVIGRATTTWLVINFESRRPQRMDSYLAERPLHHEKAFKDYAGKILPIDNLDHSFSQPVTFTDLDVNGHVNNVKYIEYIVNALDPDFCKKHQLMELEINFINEALQNDTINTMYSHKENGEILHSLKRSSDNSELCRAKTIWT